MLCLTEEGTVLHFLSLFYDVDGILTISECGEHEVGVLDSCFFFPFQSCLLRALNSLINLPKKKNKYYPKNDKKASTPSTLILKPSVNSLLWCFGAMICL